MTDFLNDLVTELGDKFASIAAQRESAAEISGYIDTGCLLFNAQLSGSLFGGFPNNKVLGLAGEEATGKTFIALGAVKTFLKNNENASVVYFDTEAAVDADTFSDRGINDKRVLIVEPDSVQSFTHKALQILNMYAKIPEDKRPPLMFVLDSLGNLSTIKELTDTAEGADTRDMTRAQLLKKGFRVLTLKLAQLRVPMIVTNHIYAVPGAYVPTKEQSGGSGLKYCASQIVFLTIGKDKDGQEVIGNIIHSTMRKSRKTKQHSKIDLRLSFANGLSKYYGLLELGEKHGVFKKATNRFEFPDGSKHYAKAVYDDPERFFTKEILDLLEVAAAKEFKYGKADDGEDDGDFDADSEVEEE